LLPETKHLISTTELSLLRPNAIVINTARGGIIDEIALATALRERQIAGAGIDVWGTEPPTTENYAELIGMQNVVALPHLGGSTDEVTKIGCMNAVDIAFDFLEGKPARNRVY
jgi:phosphoglycerate dehydrogenase-like enzyme